MCPISEEKVSPPEITKRAIVDGWKQYWDPSAQVLVEKSPQSMLKMPLLTSVFADEKVQRIKYLVVLKHPVTLNVAVPSEMGWLTNTKGQDAAARGAKKAHTSGVSSSSTAVNAVYNTELQIAENFRHFLHFMTHDEVQEHSYKDSAGAGTDSTPTSKRRRAANIVHDCSSKGWIPALDELTNQLKDMGAVGPGGGESGRLTFASSSGSSNGESESLQMKPDISVGILRYEYFQKPYQLCQALFAFVYDLSFDDVTTLDYAYVDTLGEPTKLAEAAAAHPKWSSFLRYRAARTSMCDEHFHSNSFAASASASGSSSSSGKASPGKQSGSITTFRKPGANARREKQQQPRRKLWPFGFTDSSISSDSQQTGETAIRPVDGDESAGVADVFVDGIEDMGGDDDEEEDDDLEARSHGAHGASLAKSSKQLGLAKKLAKEHEKRLRTGAKREKRLSAGRKRRKKLPGKRRRKPASSRGRAGAGARTGGLQKPRQQSSKRKRRNLRLRDQNSQKPKKSSAVAPKSSTPKLDFRPQIVSKSLRLRLSEFQQVYASKQALLMQGEWSPTSADHIRGTGTGAGANPRLGVAREHIQNNSTSSIVHKQQATLWQGLAELEKRLSAYGYSLKPAYTPFYKEKTALDTWDLMKNWKPKERADAE